MEIRQLPITDDDRQLLAKIREVDPTARIVRVRRLTLDGVEEVPQIVIPPIQKIGKR